MIINSFDLGAQRVRHKDREGIFWASHLLSFFPWEKGVSPLLMHTILTFVTVCYSRPRVRLSFSGKYQKYINVSLDKYLAPHVSWKVYVISSRQVLVSLIYSRKLEPVSFTTKEPYYPSIDDQFNVIQKRQSTGFEALKLRKDRLGMIILTPSLFVLSYASPREYLSLVCLVR